MPENSTTTTRYGIQQPNGKLCRDFPGRDPGTSYEQLPNGEWAYLWADTVTAEIDREVIARSLQFGLGDAFRELSKVVQVTITSTLEIGPIDEGDEPAGEREPRMWDRVFDIPIGARFRYGTGTETYERREDDCLHLASASMYGFSMFPSHGTNCLVEVLS